MEQLVASFCPVAGITVPRGATLGPARQSAEQLWISHVNVVGPIGPSLAMKPSGMLHALHTEIA